MPPPHAAIPRLASYPIDVARTRQSRGRYAGATHWRTSLLSLRPHGIDMLGTGKGAGANIGSIGGDRGFDGRAELTVAPHEFRHPWREPQHIFEHEDLTVTGEAAADADGGYRNGCRDAPGKRLGHGL